MIPIIKVIKVAWMLKKPLGWLAGLVRRNKKTSGTVAGASLLIAILSGEVNMEALFNPENIAYIVTAFMGIAGAVFGKKFVKIKKAIKEIGEAVDKYQEVTKDGTITAKEMKELMKEITDIYKVFRP